MLEGGGGRGVREDFHHDCYWALCECTTDSDIRVLWDSGILGIILSHAFGDFCTFPFERMTK